MFTERYYNNTKYCNVSMNHLSKFEENENE